MSNPEEPMRVRPRLARVVAATALALAAVAIGSASAGGALPLYSAQPLHPLAAGAAPASAGLGLACPSTTSTPFAIWADNANYVFLPNGGFEAGGSGWSLGGGASAVSGNESYYVHSKTDKASLSLAAGASATSPPMCISLLSSKMRFLAHGNTGASVKVQIIYQGLLSSVLGIFDGGTISVGGSWNPSPAIGMLGGVLPLLTQSVSFRFTAVGASAAIDDVYLDPLKGT
jgi:hypothetical protein